MNEHMLEVVASTEGLRILDGLKREVSFVPGDLVALAGGEDRLSEAVTKVADRARNETLADLRPVGFVVTRSRDDLGEPVWAVGWADQPAIPVATVMRHRFAMGQPPEATALADVLKDVANHAVEVVSYQRTASRLGSYEGMVGGPDLTPKPERATSRAFRSHRSLGDEAHEVATYDGQILGRLDKSHAIAAGGIQAVLWAMDRVAGMASADEPRFFVPVRARSASGDAIWSITAQGHDRFLIATPRELLDRKPTAAAESIARLLDAADGIALEQARKAEAVADEDKANSFTL